MVELVEVAQVEAAVVGPAAHAEHARVALDQLCVVVDELEQLPHEYERHEEQVEQAEYEDGARELGGEVRSLAEHLVLGAQLIAVAEWRPRTPEEQELEVVLEAGREQDPFDY